MRTAIYIEDGTVQLVLTPEGEFEKNAVSSFEGKELSVKLFSGSFYDSRGGWVRQSDYRELGGLYSGLQTKSDQSIILRIVDTPRANK